uniref:Ribonuclease H-like domain, reverse transcriptase, RNA-dependent DNA polymerase n=1 Tax=Tanacetum cinerariifolium TaxID=118510 RepID=A0A699JFR9_TANCI|nr:ribonuclease H-like domain, reverse transcriptase, RNA-dependent DNA polymerase [Tanacetum cinerariifolium]
MTRNRSYLTDYEEINREYVTFGGNSKRGKITRKGTARVETVPNKDYVLIPLWTLDPLFSFSLKNSPNDGFKPSRGRKRRMMKIQEINIVSPLDNAAGIEDNVVDENIVYGCANDPNMPELEDISIFEESNEDLPYDKRAIETKWVYKNKKDERGIVVRNKARLVAQGHTLEEGIDYDEVFAPVARIEEIRLFLTYASFKDFVVYQISVKSAFLYGKIEEEVYVC